MSSRTTERLKAALRRPIAALTNAALRLSRRQAGLVIVYHRVGDPHQRWDEGGLNPRLGTDFLEAQLRYLRATYRVVPVSELLAAVRSRRRGERFPVAITFDDDWPSHVAASMPILKRVGVPATFFATGGGLSGPFSFWWDRVERALERGSLTSGELREMVPAASGGEPSGTSLRAIAADIERLPPDRREALSDRLREVAGPDPAGDTLDGGGLRLLAENGFDIGFHTLRHLNLAILDSDQLQLAMTEGREQLEAATGQELASIAYPGGKWQPQVVEAARSAGYRLGFTTDAEPVLPENDPLSLGRVDPIWCDTLGHFALTLSRVLRSA